MRKDELIIYIYSDIETVHSPVNTPVQRQSSPKAVQSRIHALYALGCTNPVTLSIVIIHAGPYLCKIKMV